MRQTILMLMLVLVVCFSACSGNQAEELLETAKLEELQNNFEHSRQIYQEIIEKYPQSEYAKEAQGRLSALPEK